MRLSNEGKVSKAVLIIDAIAFLVLCYAAGHYYYSRQKPVSNNTATNPSVVKDVIPDPKLTSSVAILKRLQTAKTVPLTLGEKAAITQTFSANISGKNLTPQQRQQLVDALNAQSQ